MRTLKDVEDSTNTIGDREVALPWIATPELFMMSSHIAQFVLFRLSSRSLVCLTPSSPVPDIMPVRSEVPGTE